MKNINGSLSVGCAHIQVHTTLHKGKHRGRQLSHQHSCTLNALPIFASLTRFLFERYRLL